MKWKNQLFSFFGALLGIIFLVLLSTSVHAQCEFEIEKSVDDLTINAEIYNPTDFGPYHPQVVQWFLNEEPVGTDPILNYTVDDYGVFEICAEYEVSFPDNTSCVDQNCESILVPSPTECQAYFEYGLYTGDLPNVGGVSFSNLSVGDFTNVSWNFGDGNFDSEIGDSLTHFYENDGLYNVCLTIWNDTGCQSEYCHQVGVFIADSTCYQTDCVFPGDANYDGEANLIDLLHIGYGLGQSGPVRPNASTDWIGQNAPDWGYETLDGVNYKHLDCDGNGTINEDDLDPVLINYTAIHNGITSVEGSAPVVFIEFDSDSIIIDDNSPDQILVTANLILGTAETPAENFSGIALFMEYDSQYVIENTVTVEYQNNSFFGDGTNGEVLWMPNDIYEEEQVDMGFSRINGSTVTGNGVLAKISFIISEDIIGGFTENQISLPLSLNVVSAFNGTGQQLEVKTTEVPASILVVDLTTNVVNPELRDKVKVFPNPVDEDLNIDLGTLIGNQVEIFNAIGQLVLRKEMNGSEDRIKVDALASGLYFVNIHTDKGIANKRVIIK